MFKLLIKLSKHWMSYLQNRDLIVLLVLLSAAMVTSCNQPPLRTPVIPTTTVPTALPTATPASTPAQTQTPTLSPTNTPRPTPGPSLADLLATPQVLVENEQTELAELALSGVRDVYPNSADPWLIEAQIAAADGDVLEQSTLIREAVGAEPGSTLAFLMLAQFLSSSTMASDDLPPADAPVSARIEALARLYGQADYEAMQQYATDSLSEYPDAEGLYSAQGFAYLSLSDEQAASQAFQRAVDIDFDDPYLLLWHGRTLIAKGAYSQAVSTLTVARRAAIQQGGLMAPVEVEAVAELAVAQAQLDLDKAYSDLGDEVFEIGSIDPYILAYARIDLQLSDYDIAIFRLFDLVDSGYTPALYYLAVAYHQTDQADLALEALDRFLAEETYGPLAEQAHRLQTELQDS